MNDDNSFTVTRENISGIKAKYIGNDIRLMGSCKIPRFTHMSRISDYDALKSYGLELEDGDWVASAVQEDGSFILYNSSQDEPKFTYEPQIGA